MHNMHFHAGLDFTLFHTDGHISFVDTTFTTSTNRFPQAESMHSNHVVLSLNSASLLMLLISLLLCRYMNVYAIIVRSICAECIRTCLPNIIRLGRFCHGTFVLEAFWPKVISLLLRMILFSQIEVLEHSQLSASCSNWREFLGVNGYSKLGQTEMVRTT